MTKQIKMVADSAHVYKFWEKNPGYTVYSQYFKNVSEIILPGHVIVAVYDSIIHFYLVANFFCLKIDDTCLKITPFNKIDQTKYIWEVSQSLKENPN